MANSNRVNDGLFIFIHCKILSTVYAIKKMCFIVRKRYFVEYKLCNMYTVCGGGVKGILLLMNVWQGVREEFRLTFGYQ